MSRLSIRMKILVIFMSLFTIALGASFYWFYQFATQRTTENLQQSLILSASTAARLVDADEVMLVSDSEGEDTEVEYEHLASQLRLVQESNPKVANIYIMVPSPNADDELLFVVDVEADIEIVGEPYDTGGQSELVDAFNGPVASATLQEDEYGSGFQVSRRSWIRGDKASPSSGWICRRRMSSAPGIRSRSPASWRSSRLMQACSSPPSCFLAPSPAPCERSPARPRRSNRESRSSLRG